MPSKKQFYVKMTQAAVRSVSYAMTRNVHDAINDIREMQKENKNNDSLTIKIVAQIKTPKDGIGSCQILKVSWDKSIPRADTNLPKQEVDLINEDLPLFQTPNQIKQSFFEPVVPTEIEKWGKETEMICIFPASIGQNVTLPMSDKKIIRYYPSSGEIIVNISPAEIPVENLLQRCDELMKDAIIFDKWLQIMPYSQKRIDENTK